MKLNTTNSIKEADQITSKEYDLYAPMVYGKILHTVPEGPIANRLLEKVFVNAYSVTNRTSTIARAPLVSLLSQARDKSEQTMKALEIFSACCAGASVSINDKK